MDEHDDDPARYRARLDAAFRTAVDRSDELFEMARSARDRDDAERLVGERFDLTPDLAHAVLSLQFFRLTQKSAAQIRAQAPLQ